jgi:thiol-disulfide isomerase/thioredoxin
VRLLAAPAYPDAAVLVADFAAQAAQQGRRLVVYVGAPWCEPCRHLHEAAEHGGLDDRVGPLDLLMFDAEVDAARLQAAGYSSRLIPLLAVPGPDGRASGLQMEGGIKGEGAVENLVPRLQAMLDQ